jgi:hypothetical protein
MNWITVLAEFTDQKDLKDFVREEPFSRLHTMIEERSTDVCVVRTDEKHLRPLMTTLLAYGAIPYIVTLPQRYVEHVNVEGKQPAPSADETLMRVRVGLYYETMGYVEVQAPSEKAAERQVLEVMATEGIEAFGAFDTTHREYHIVESKCINSEETSDGLRDSTR